jgi:hypothetical protein
MSSATVKATGELVKSEYTSALCRVQDMLEQERRENTKSRRFNDLVVRELEETRVFLNQKQLEVNSLTRLVEEKDKLIESLKDEARSSNIDRTAMKILTDKSLTLVDKYSNQSRAMQATKSALMDLRAEKCVISEANSAELLELIRECSLQKITIAELKAKTHIKKLTKQRASLPRIGS